MIGISPLLLFLLIILIGISYRAFNDEILFNQLKFNIRAIQNGEYYRLFTAGFIHVDFNHLLFNGFTLYVFGDNTLFGLGVVNFFLLYLISLFAGNLFALYYHRDNPYYSAVGASGAIIGVVYSCILMFPEMKLALIFFPVPFPAYVFGIGYLIYTVFGIQSQRDNIGHTAHFGGALGGIVATLFFRPEVMDRSFYTLLIMVTITLIAAIYFLRKKA